MDAMYELLRLQCGMRLANGRLCERQHREFTQGFGGQKGARVSWSAYIGHPTLPQQVVTARIHALEGLSYRTGVFGRGRDICGRREHAVGHDNYPREAE